MKFLANYIMRGRTQAIMVASSLALLALIMPPVSIVSSAAIGLVTLRQGIKEGAYTLVCACWAAAILGFILLGDYYLPLSYGLMLWIPVWMIATILREGRHLFLAIQIVVIIAILAVVGAYLYQPELGLLWNEWLNGFIEPMITQSRTDLNSEEIQASLKVFYHFVMTGLVAELYVLTLLSGLFLARWWQSVLYNPDGFIKEYLSLQGRQGLGLFSLVVLIVGWMSSGLIAEICWNISLILICLYAFLGTVILHVSFLNMKMKKFLVPFVYITLVLIPHLVFPMAILGLADTWLNLRNKILNQPSP